MIPCLECSVLGWKCSGTGPPRRHTYFSYSWNHPGTFGCSGQRILGSPRAPFKHRQYNIILAKCKELHLLSLLCCGFILPSHAVADPLVSSSSYVRQRGTMRPCKRHHSPYCATLGLGRGLTIRKVNAYAKIPPSYSLRSKPSPN